MTTRPARATFYQSGNAEGRFAAQFERVAIAVVLTTQDDMDAFQAAQGLQINCVAAYRQVLALDQRKTEVAGEIGVFEIGFVVRPGRQQHDVWRFVTIDRRQRAQPVELVAEKIGQVLDVQVAKHLGEDARDDQPVFQRIACPGRRLRAVGDDPPAAVRRTRQIDGVIVQPDTTSRLDALTGPQVAVLTIDQRGRQQTFGEELLLAIEIGQHGIEQGGTLGDCRRYLGPFVGRDNQRQRIERPRPVGAVRIGIDVVGDAIFLDAPVDELQTLVHLVRRHRIEVAEELPPVRTYDPVRRQHFVVAAGAVRVDCEECACHSAGKKDKQAGNRASLACCYGRCILG